ncbi:MAG: metallophosphoesterase [Anaerolineaceae bacterium]|nr:metallophosphoesterase [Anaerolineaceae bacterium]MCB9099216.1 metallophosphoesterase [Anaerolineales bacterium]
MGHKLKFVVSDLHLGAGQTTQGLAPLEDFTASREFIAFLHEIGQEGERDEREIELIFNGDLFEFLQVPAVDNYDPTQTYPKEAYLNSSEEASIKRLKIIVAGHQEIFNALADFMHSNEPQRRITIIKGNHDVCLFWPGVKGYLREVLGASGARVSLLRFADEFVSREKIYVEHGHQHAEKMNGYQDSFNPRSTDDPSQLFYPAGSHFVIDFFNQVEPERPFIDHIKPLTTLIWYALHWDFDFAGRALACFIRKTPALVVSDTNYWQKNSIAPTGSLLQELEDEVQRQKLAERYKTDTAFRQAFHYQIQQYLDDASIDNKGSNPSPPLHVSDNPLQMGQINQQQQRAMLRRAAVEVAEREKAKVIIFGHTHEPTEELLSNGSIYINTGSWISDLSKISLNMWEALFNSAALPETIPSALTYARIDYNEDEHPYAKLLYFKGQTHAKKAASRPEKLAEPPSFLRRNMRRFIRRFGSDHS